MSVQRDKNLYIRMCLFGGLLIAFAKEILTTIGVA